MISVNNTLIKFLRLCSAGVLLLCLFPTLAQAAGSPIVTTNAVSALTTSGATLHGTVISNGHTTTVSFNYGTTTGYGSNVTASQSPLASPASDTAVLAVDATTVWVYALTATAVGRIS